jgi:DNA-binding CsgD family transcriptional regulator
MVVIICWIAAYSLCLANVGLLLYLYRGFRDRRLLYFLVLIINTLVITVVIMLLTMFLEYGKPFAVIMVNCLLSYVVTVPLFAYESAGMKRPTTLIIVVSAVSLVVLNLLVCFGNPLVAYSVFWVPFIPLLLPVFVRTAGKNAAQPAEGGRTFGGALSRAGIALGSMAFVCGCVYLVLARTALGHNAFFIRAYFAFFTILYQLPITGFCLGRFPELRKGSRAGTAPADADLSGLNLTAREREVALKLYEGLTYDQIANAMFVSLSAVKKHAYNIYRKTGVSNNRQLIRRMMPRNRDGEYPSP